MKAGKEEIVGLVAAVERYLDLDHAAQMHRWESQVAFLVDALRDIPGVTARRVCPAEPGIQPVGIPRVYVDTVPPAPANEEIIAVLRSGDPAVAVGDRGGGLALNPQTLHPGDEKVVGRRLREILAHSRKRG